MASCYIQPPCIMTKKTIAVCLFIFLLCCCAKAVSEAGRLALDRHIGARARPLRKREGKENPTEQGGNTTKQQCNGPSSNKEELSLGLVAFSAFVQIVKLKFRQK